MSDGMPIAGERKQGGAWKKLREQVFREEDVCYLCGEWVDKELPHTDPMSKSVDHLIPIVKGGSETDRANVKLAHLYCNKARGAKDIDEVRYTPQSQEW